MRISGFASGMDIDQMVKELMTAHRKPLDKLTQQKTLLEWKREDYRDMSIKMVDFRNNKLANLNQSNVINAKKAQVNGDTSVLTAKAVGSTSSGSMSIKVTELAKSASVKSAASIGTNISETKTLDQLKADGILSFTSNTITVNGKAITVDPSVDTIQTLVNKINTSKEAKATAFFDYASGQLSLTNKETGSGNVGVAGDLLTGAAAFDLNTHSAGANASVEINGMAITRSSNRFTINGVELTLTAKSGAQLTTIDTVTDTDAIVDSIKSFIKDYNEMISAINGELNEKRNRTYAPLTDEQKKDLKEDEIKLCQEKARSGTLRNDGILSKVVTDLRLAAIADVGTGANAINITDIGINTGEWNDRGKLRIVDEAKLREAINEDPEKVLALFSTAGSSTDPADPNVGVFNRMRGILATGLDELAKKAGTSRMSTDVNQEFLKDSLMENDFIHLDRRITDYSRRLSDLETRYYKQFTAMETAINKFNSQSGALSNFMN